MQLARNIERCAKHKIRKRIYEGCCERAQARMFAEQERKKNLVKDCFDKGGGQNCYNTVSYTHLRAPRDATLSRMPSSA